ncbi:MAG TPA: DUF294 nucleotidyltransferase-like domain-containing protein [Alcanivoracaceae bacterium]|nr:DUF294 nucleotidyltransferase-like domain-containing protein [Alcanivoracaceae bacterium]
MRKKNVDSAVARTAVEDNLQGIMSFLREYPPFNQMEDTHVGYLIEHSILRFYGKHESIISPSDGPIEHFYIVKQGRIIGLRNFQFEDVSEQTELEEKTTFEITMGECFPISALMAERATRTTHLAAEDTFCLLVSKPAFVYLLNHCVVFRDYCVRGISGLLDHAVQQIRQQAAATVGTQYSLDTSLSELVLREPVTGSGELPIRDAVRLMHEQQVGSLPIVNEANFPVGIFTLRDLRTVIASQAHELEQPVSTVMTANPTYLSPRHTAFDAAVAMTEQHIAHLCIVEQGRLVGMISERDLFALQRMDLVHLARTLRNAPTVESLVMMRADVEQLVERMTAQGASPEQLTHLITLLNDHTVCRVIELMIKKHGAPEVPFTWLVFGSEARQEQTLHTDQDNGMLFEASTPAEAERIRQLLLPLAHAINKALHACGFTWCPGNIMASNPELCLSYEEWRQRFASLVRNSTPENLLYSTIYFDLRGIWGEVEKVEALRRYLLSHTQENKSFQRLLAQNAMQHRPPLGGFFRDFSLAKKGEHKNTVDLKIQGLAPFVDGMRVLALAHGVEAVNTLDRLRLLMSKGVIDRLDGEAYEEAYHFIQLLRMQEHHRQAREGLEYSNRIAPHKLNNLDKRILRESLRQAQRLQSSLTFRYKL